MNRRAGPGLRKRLAWTALLLVGALLLAVPGLGESADEVYDREIRSLLTVAILHLQGITDAISECAGNPSQCVEDPATVLERLNASVTGLAAVRASALDLAPSARYEVVHGLVLQGLNDSIRGGSLYSEGIEEGRLDKFSAGSDLVEIGQTELSLAVDLLNDLRPRSPLENVLLVVVIVLGASLGTAIAVILWWYRRLTEAPPSSEDGATASPSSEEDASGPSPAPGDEPGRSGEGPP